MSTFTGNKWNNHFGNNNAKDIENDVWTKKFLFPDFSLTWINILEKFPYYSRYSLTFRKSGLFSELSRFSMNPGISINWILRYVRRL